jgi:RNA polymerase sigma factor (sigma-70 family)
MTNGTSKTGPRSADKLFARARAGDQSAWEELFHACYPKIRRVVRRKLNPPLRSLYDSTDFASDVLGSLVAKRDRFDFPNLTALLAFLERAAQQKVIDAYRKRHTLKNDATREVPLDVRHDDGRLAPRALVSPDPTPSQIALANEGLERVRARLTAEERRVLELKGAGHTTEEIARQTSWHVRKIQRFLKDLGDSWHAAERTDEGG